jgi:predicted nucleic acid binding AN1-type Zn finger protein/uncharacterized C2H2 Zn-finger protein
LGRKNRGSNPQAKEHKHSKLQEENTMDIGAHCAMSQCNQQDFLPFTCDCCSSIFCLHHRSYDAHDCPKAGSKDRRVLECPVCRDLIHWTAEQDVDEVWTQHARSKDCTSEKYHQIKAEKAKKKKNRCASKKCKEILVPSNQFHCGLCNQRVCLKHRFENDHDCQEVINTRKKNRLAALATKKKTTTNINTTRVNSSSSAAAAAVKATKNVAETTKNAVQNLVQTAKAAASNTINTNSEECPICQKKFNYVSQLIAHVNRTHPETNTRPPPALPTSTNATSTLGRSNEVCPQCHATFEDVGALIQHVEIVHSNSASSSSNGERACCLM